MNINIVNYIKDVYHPDRSKILIDMYNIILDVIHEYDPAIFDSIEDKMGNVTTDGIMEDIESELRTQLVYLNALHGIQFNDVSDKVLVALLKTVINIPTRDDNEDLLALMSTGDNEEKLAKLTVEITGLDYMTIIDSLASVPDILIDSIISELDGEVPVKEYTEQKLMLMNLAILHPELIAKRMALSLDVSFGLPMKVYYDLAVDSPKGFPEEAEIIVLELIGFGVLALLDDDEIIESVRSLVEKVYSADDEIFKIIPHLNSFNIRNLRGVIE